MIPETLIFQLSNTWNAVLSDKDTARAEIVARKNQNISPKDYRGAVLSPDEGYQLWLSGLKGEIAVARVGKLHWSGSIDEDVPPYQVKTVTKYHHRLFIPEKGRHQEPDQIYISVLEYRGCFSIRGWLTVRELQSCPQEDFGYSGRNLCWVAENEFLHPMTDLKEFK